VSDLTAEMMKRTRAVISKTFTILRLSLLVIKITVCVPAITITDTEEKSRGI